MEKEVMNPAAGTNVPEITTNPTTPKGKGKPAPKGKGKPAPKGKSKGKEKSESGYLRISAVAEVLKANPALVKEPKKAIAKADELFTKKTKATSNIKETTTQFGKCVAVLKVVGIIPVN